MLFISLPIMLYMVYVRQVSIIRRPLSIEQNRPLGEKYTVQTKFVWSSAQNCERSDSVNRILSNQKRFPGRTVYYRLMVRILSAEL